jgi:hypothetical protein
MSGLDDLLDAARHADKGSRILLRDEIAAYGDQAVGPMVGWLKDPRLGAFGVRVLQVIAADPANRGSVITALSAVNLSGLSPEVAGDVRKALTELRPTAAPRGSTGAHGPSREKGRDVWRERGGGSILEERFHDSMLSIYWLAGHATGYWASYFLRGVRNKGGVIEARDLLLPVMGTSGPTHPVTGSHLRSPRRHRIGAPGCPVCRHAIHRLDAVRQANERLLACDQQEIDWRLPGDP